MLIMSHTTHATFVSGYLSHTLHTKLGLVVHQPVQSLVWESRCAHPSSRYDRLFKGQAEWTVVQCIAPWSIDVQPQSTITWPSSALIQRWCNPLTIKHESTIIQQDDLPSGTVMNQPFFAMSAMKKPLETISYPTLVSRWCSSVPPIQDQRFSAASSSHPSVACGRKGASELVRLWRRYIWGWVKPSTIQEIEYYCTSPTQLDCSAQF